MGELVPRSARWAGRRLMMLWEFMTGPRAPPKNLNIFFSSEKKIWCMSCSQEKGFYIGEENPGSRGHGCSHDDEFLVLILDVEEENWMDNEGQYV